MKYLQSVQTDGITSLINTNIYCNFIETLHKTKGDKWNWKILKSDILPIPLFYTLVK